MSGLAYSESFTVESYFNGTSFTYLIAFVNGVPSTTLLAEKTTSEPNGLCLTVPVEPTDIPDFRKKAESLYRYFEVKPTVNVELEMFLPESDFTSDNWQFHDRASSVLMSNIRYFIPSWHELNTHGLSNMLFYAPTGAISINPGRESLSLDTHTKQWIQSAFDSAAEEYTTLLNTHISAQTTIKDQITAYVEAYSRAPYRIRSNISVNITDPAVAAIYSSKYNELFFPDSISIHHRYPDDVRSKPWSEIDLRVVYNATYIINDLKTNFTSAIAAIQKQTDKRCFIFSPNGVDYETFHAALIPILDALAIKPLYTSNFKQERKTTSTVRITSDIQVCDACGVDTFLNSCAYNPNQKYLYVPLKGFNRTDNSPEHLALFELYSLVRHKLPYKVVGVQKKYLAAASKNPNFTLFSESYDLLTKGSKFYLIKGSYDTFYRFSELPNIPLVASIKAEKARYGNFKDKAAAEGRIPITNYLYEQFPDLDVTEYTHTSYAKALYSRYPHLEEIHRKTNKTVVHRYIELEDFYATHSNKDN